MKFGDKTALITAFNGNADSVTVTVPDSGGTSGKVDVNVATSGGTTANTAQDDYTNQSNVATLLGQSLSQGTLSPSFDASTSSDTASVAHAVVNLTMTDASATVQVNGTAVASGAIPLSVGPHTISVAVTAQDGTTTQTYTVTVTRAPLGDLITFGPVATAVVGGATLPVSATAVAGQSISLSSLSPTICSLSGAMVTPLAQGNCLIQGSTAGNTAYAAAQATLTITVDQRPDPTQNQSMIAVVQAQQVMAQNFATGQVQTISSHLDDLRLGSFAQDRFNIQVTLPIAPCEPRPPKWPQPRGWSWVWDSRPRPIRPAP